jgi:hypothetical protein
MPNGTSEKFDELFMGLVVSFQVSALQYLGKLVNPHTGKSERSLEGASAAIDMLDMLAAKTRGKLKAEEEKFLNETISHLKLNYVEESAKPPPATEPGQPLPQQG